MARSKAPVHILLVRSGETEWEVQGRIRGQTDLPLSPHAVEILAKALVNPPPVKVVRHASDEASTATARLIARTTRARRRKLVGLEPPNLGLLEGLTLEEAADRYPSRSRIWQETPLALKPPEGEPLLDLVQRAGGALARTVARSSSSMLAIVAHPMVIGALRVVLADAKPERYHELAHSAPRLESYILPPDAAQRLMRRVSMVHVE